MSIGPILKYPGSKWRLADWIIFHMPRHKTYLEPYLGSGAIFFNKPPSDVETINDISGSIVNLFRIIRERPQELATLINFTPWSRDEYNFSYEQTEDDLENARRFLIRCWQAFGTKTNAKTGWRNDIGARKYINMPDQWRMLPERILVAADRLRDVQIENQPAVKLIERYKFDYVLIYADPPYPLSTRHGKMYANEMTDEDHVELLNVLDRHPGPVILSGYACELYDMRLRHWERKTHIARAEKGLTRQEVLWLNPVAARGMQTLF